MYININRTLTVRTVLYTDMYMKMNMYSYMYRNIKTWPLIDMHTDKDVDTATDMHR